ncbi:MAG TPA: hypothetical protein VFK02_05620 [Kofleriaceae bacterium]|nr:hypothetical protein [Kofleriaceae bacterium]
MAPWLALAVVVVVARWRWNQLIDPQVPFVGWDAQVFQQIAERPLGLDLVGSSKPLVVPLVYRAAHGDLPAVARIQAELAFAAWTILTITTALVVRRGWVRALAVGVGLSFLLEPVRVGFASSMLPESIDDSLAALSIAGLLAVRRLHGGARLAVASATGVVVLAWLFTRDTNLFIAVTAAGVAMVVWRGWRSRAAWALLAAVVATSGVVLWSTTVAHEQLPYQRNWRMCFTPRASYPMLNNIKLRVFPDERDDLPTMLQHIPGVIPMVVDSPQLAPLQTWLVEDGPSTYARWLVRHPVDRLRELIRHRWVVLAANVRAYMPGHWVPRSPSFRTLTSTRWILTLLMLTAPLLLRRPRADPLCGVALCIVVSGLVGAVASYYGDATELARHCYGAGQQIVLGLVLAALAWMDRVQWHRRDGVRDQA